MGNLFGKPATPAVTPLPEPAPVTPMVDDAAIDKKRKTAMLAQRARSGRASTLLSESNTLGA